MTLAQEADEAYLAEKLHRITYPLRIHLYQTTTTTTFLLFPTPKLTLRLRTSLHDRHTLHAGTAAEN